MTDVISIPAVRWATGRPNVGPWYFDIPAAPHEGVRDSAPLAVFDAKTRRITWAHYFEATVDAGATVSESGWLSDDPCTGDDHLEVAGWIEAET